MEDLVRVYSDEFIIAYNKRNKEWKLIKHELNDLHRFFKIACIKKEIHHYR